MQGREVKSCEHLTARLILRVQTSPQIDRQTDSQSFYVTLDKGHVFLEEIRKSFTVFLKSSSSSPSATLSH